jgi:hypothetical protein
MRFETNKRGFLHDAACIRHACALIYTVGGLRSSCVRFQLARVKPNATDTVNKMYAAALSRQIPTNTGFHMAKRTPGQEGKSRLMQKYHLSPRVAILLTSERLTRQLYPAERNARHIEKDSEISKCCHDDI